jgi:hypothetical protein
MAIFRTYEPGLQALPRTDDAAARQPQQTGLDFKKLLGLKGWHRLHPAIRRRFHTGHGHKPVCYTGPMSVQRNAAGLIFAIATLPFGAPLPIATSKNLRSEVSVSTDSKGGVIWERRLFFAAGQPPVIVRSVKRTDERQLARYPGTVMECIDGGKRPFDLNLGMVLALTERNHALVFESTHYFLEWRGLRLALPNWCGPGRCTVTHEAEDDRHFWFIMRMEHPLFGLTFEQIGLFLDPEA